LSVVAPALFFLYFYLKLCEIETNRLQNPAQQTDVVLKCADSTISQEKQMQYNSRFASKNELASYLAATPDKPGLLVQKYAQTELPELPDHIAILSIYYCPALKALPRLPKSLTELWIHSCPSLAELPDFPSTMTILSITDCPAVEELPPLAGGLKELMLGNCGIKTLPAIPASLKDLRLNLPGIKYLPELPHSLAHLHLCGCSALTGRVITVGKLSIRVN
jgi:hypothetical protein